MLDFFCFSSRIFFIEVVFLSPLTDRRKQRAAGQSYSISTISGSMACAFLLEKIPRKAGQRNITGCKKGAAGSPPESLPSPQGILFFSIVHKCAVHNILCTGKRQANKEGYLSRYPSAPGRSSRFLPAFGNDGISTLPRRNRKVNRFFCKIRGNFKNPGRSFATLGETRFCLQFIFRHAILAKN